MYRKFLRPGWIVGHLLVVVAVLVCLRLGLWQWHRTHEATGTVQNLGYTILWPVFGAAFIYMWVRFLQLELTKDAEDDAELTEMAAGEGTQSHDDPSGVTHDSVSAGESVEPGRPGDTESTSTGADASEVAGVVGASPTTEGVVDDRGEPVPSAAAVSHTVSRRPPSRGYTVAISTVGDDNDEEDPELAAYNRALAALAEKDHRRAR